MTSNRNYYKIEDMVRWQWKIWSYIHTKKSIYVLLTIHHLRANTYWMQYQGLLYLDSLTMGDLAMYSYKEEHLYFISHTSSKGQPLLNDQYQELLYLDMLTMEDLVIYPYQEEHLYFITNTSHKGQPLLNGRYKEPLWLSAEKAFFLVIINSYWSWALFSSQYITKGPYNLLLSMRVSCIPSSFLVNADVQAVAVKCDCGSRVIPHASVSAPCPACHSLGGTP